MIYHYFHKTVKKPNSKSLIIKFWAKSSSYASNATPYFIKVENIIQDWMKCCCNNEILDYIKYYIKYFIKIRTHNEAFIN